MDTKEKCSMCKWWPATTKCGKCESCYGILQHWIKNNIFKRKIDK